MLVQAPCALRPKSAPRAADDGRWHGSTCCCIWGCKRCPHSVTEWKAISDAQDVFEGRDRATGELMWTGTRIGLVFGSNCQLRALAEVYGSADVPDKFASDLVAAWNKVTNLDRLVLA